MQFISSKLLQHCLAAWALPACFIWGLLCGYVDAKTVVTGADISAAIIKTLELEGENAAPQIVEKKKFFPCDTPLEVLPMFGSWKTVRVACAAPIPWKLTVRAQWSTAYKINPESNAELPKNTMLPTKAKANFFTEAEGFEVLTLARSVSRGEILTAEDIVIKSVRQGKARGAIEDPNRAIGRKVRQNLSSRQVLKPRHLEKNWLIEKNDIIAMRVNRGGIEVMGVGVAQEPGQMGEIIRMRNASSGVLLRVKVTGEKNVDVISKTLR